MKEYIIHGTDYKNLIKILQDGYIDNKPSKKNLMVLTDNPSNQIFTQLIYYDIPNQQYENEHWFSCAIVLDKQILKDYPFYATKVGKFSENFDDGKYNKDTIIFGEGNFNKMPNLRKLKNQINKQMENKNLDNSLAFIHSHEILFNKKIYLDKYCINIIIITVGKEYEKDKEIKKIIDLAKEKNINLKFRDSKLRRKLKKPINTFIDIIENK